MFYILQNSHKYDKILQPYIHSIIESCNRSEFQFLSKEELRWNISNNMDFLFEEFYYVNEKVPVFGRQVWETITSSLDTDGIFSIPVVINFCGEHHFYNIAIPPRINCLDKYGKIILKNVGRYQMFKSKQMNDSNIYVTEKLVEQLRKFAALKWRGMEE